MESDHCAAISLTSSGSESSHALSPTAARALRYEGGTAIITPTIVVLPSPGPMGIRPEIATPCPERRECGSACRELGDDGAGVEPNLLA